MITGALVAETPASVGRLGTGDLIPVLERLGNFFGVCPSAAADGVVLAMALAGIGRCRDGAFDVDEIKEIGPSDTLVSYSN